MLRAFLEKNISDRVARSCGGSERGQKCDLTDLSFRKQKKDTEVAEEYEHEEQQE